MPRPKKSERESPWFKYGTDADYQKFCRTLPCAVTGLTSNVIFAHHRNAGNAGTGFKPPYSGIPMDYFEHLRQHEVYQYVYMPKARWEFLVNLHLERWINSLALQD